MSQTGQTLLLKAVLCSVRSMDFEVGFGGKPDDVRLQQKGKVGVGGRENGKREEVGDLILALGREGRLAVAVLACLGNEWPGLAWRGVASVAGKKLWPYKFAHRLIRRSDTLIAKPSPASREMTMLCLNASPPRYQQLQHPPGLV